MSSFAHMQVFLWVMYHAGIQRSIWISSNEVNETGAYYTEWSKPEEKTPIQYTAAKSLQSCPTLIDVRPHRQQPTRLRDPWDSPGKNTGVGCHFFLQWMKVKSKSEVAQSCTTRRDPMDCNLPGSSIHWSFQARVLEWVAIAFSNTVY